MIDPSMKKLITILLILILGAPAAFSQQVRDIEGTVVLHRDGVFDLLFVSYIR